jgi:hypothetical protein
MDSREVPIILQSKYDSGLDKIYAMGNIRRGLHDYKIFRKFPEWYQCLRSWRSEMNSAFSTDERDKCEKYQRVFETYLYGYIFDDVPKDITDQTVDRGLYEYELYLGDLADKYNLGIGKADMDEGL